MNLAFGSYRVRIDKWENYHRLMWHMNECDAGNVMLGTPFYGTHYNYSVTFFDFTASDKKASMFGVGIAVDYQFVEPALLFDYASLRVAIGLAHAVAIVDAVEKRLVAELPALDFRRFHSLAHLGIDRYFLVEDELSLQAIAFDGKLVWTYDAGDILGAVEIIRDTIKVNVGIWGEQEPIKLSLKNGKPL